MEMNITDIEKTSGIINRTATLFQYDREYVALLVMLLIGLAVLIAGLIALNIPADRFKEGSMEKKVADALKSSVFVALVGTVATGAMLASSLSGADVTGYYKSEPFTVQSVERVKGGTTLGDRSEFLKVTPESTTKGISDSELRGFTISPDDGKALKEGGTYIIRTKRMLLSKQDALKVDMMKYPIIVEKVK